MLSFRGRCLIGCVLSVTPLLASASGEPLDLSEALVRALRSHPALAAAGLALRAQDGAIQQAAAAPNPELSVDVEDALGSGARQSLDAAQTTLSLRWQLERGAQPLRTEAARAGRSLIELSQDEQRLDVAAETARRFIQVLANQERQRLVEQASGLAAAAVAAARLRVEAGKAPDAELARAEAAAARQDLEREDIEHELLTSRHALAAQWGDTEARFPAVQGQLADLPTAAPYEALLAGLARNPGLLRYSSEGRLRDAEIRLAEQRRKPAWTLSTGLRHFKAGDDYAGVFGLSLPLPWRDRGEGAIASAQAQRQAVDAQAAAAQLRAQTQLFALYQELLHARHVAERLEKDVVPRLQAALLGTQQAYERGRYSFLELGAAQRELLDAQAARIEASASAHGLAIEIDRLTGAVPALTD